MSILLSNIVLTYLDPIFALKMLEMDIFADKAGYVYVFLLGSYAFFGFSGGLLEQLASKRTLIIAGYLCGFLGFCVIAHKFFVDANHLALIVLGLFMTGFSVIGGNMFATMFTKAKLMEAAEEAGVPRKVAGAYFGGLKGSCNLLGTFLGPLISPNIYLLCGFEKACIAMGICQLIFVGIFYAKSKQDMAEKRVIDSYELKGIQLQSKNL